MTDNEMLAEVTAAIVKARVDIEAASIAINRAFAVIERAQEARSGNALPITDAPGWDGRDCPPCDVEADDTGAIMR